ncbi:MAG: alanine--glyoxylate aminotransferase family protein [Chthonomonadales bacterium]
MSSLPFPRVLLGPGPSSVSGRVLEVVGRPPIGYLDPELLTIMPEIMAKLRTVFGTANEFTLPLTGTGMAGMECCLTNLLEPSDNVVIGVNGFFGGRMVEIARRCGANVTQVDFEWGTPVLPGPMREAASAILGKVKLIGCVHAETSTGTASPLAPIGALARELGALFVVDAVTSLGGMAVELDKNQVDACYSATQKCMGCLPGMAPVSFSDRAIEAIKARKSAPQSWYLDINLLKNYWSGDHMYHHTISTNMALAFRESLLEIDEEGLEARFERHRTASDVLINGLVEMGIEPFAQAGFRLPMLNSVKVPDGIADMEVRGRLLREYGIEIGGGLGAAKGKIWRIGLMGDSARLRNVELLLAALKRVLHA